ncbi:hypothetical protein [Salinarimonas soli]|uniref:Proteophosphoglycan ppg4 n=1 Tax=Salinarimonas soli TaxID=1638099 RepID=A0A5B2VEQ1_9HYPH|nr:hypothetical protein [Salinarimonas soli]KAA2236667.1 hypothetical protein F0L46_13610 [Salinarimonas soli]
MKKLMIAAAAAALLAGPALAQTTTAPASNPNTQTQGNNPHLGGDNQDAGGPAGRASGTRAPMSSGTMVAPSTTGTVRSADPAATADPLTRTQGNPDSRGGPLTPSFQQGDNQQAGGPANELNTQTGGAPRR